MNSDVLVNQLKIEIQKAVKNAIRCPTCLKVITKAHSIYFQNAIFYHSQCQPVR